MLVRGVPGECGSHEAHSWACSYEERVGNEIGMNPQRSVRWLPHTPVTTLVDVIPSSVLLGFRIPAPWSGASAPARDSLNSLAYLRLISGDSGSGTPLSPLGSTRAGSRVSDLRCVRLAAGTAARLLGVLLCPLVSTRVNLCGSQAARKRVPEKQPPAWCHRHHRLDAAVATWSAKSLLQEHIKPLMSL